MHSVGFSKTSTHTLYVVVSGQILARDVGDDTVVRRCAIVSPGAIAFLPLSMAEDIITRALLGNH
jgi:hypothetical protein